MKKESESFSSKFTFFFKTHTNLAGNHVYFMFYPCILLLMKQSRRAAGMAQGVEQLPSKCGALSSNPSNVKNNKKQT
jgi:hypothetical protein